MFFWGIIVFIMRQIKKIILIIVFLTFLLSPFRVNAVESTEIHFSKAVVAFGEKNYQEAAEEFEAVVKINPTDSKAYYYLGSCYFYLKDYPKAKEALLKASALDPALEGATGVLIDEMEGEKRMPPEKKKLSISGKFGVEYDDNVILNPSGTVTAVTDEKDSRAVFDLNLDYKLLEEPLGLAGFYHFYQSRHGELTDYNIQGHTIGISTSAKRDPWKFRGQYSFDYYYLGLSRNNYLAVHTLIPTANLTLGKDKLIQFYYQFRQKNYFQCTAGATDQDAVNNMAGVNQYFFFGNKSYLKLGYSYENNNAEGNNWDYNGHYVLLSYLYPLNENLKLKLGFTYNPARYQNIDTAANKKREDNQQEYSLSLSRKVNQSFGLSFGYTYVDNDSNIATYKYERSICSLTTEFKF